MKLNDKVICVNDDFSQYPRVTEDYEYLPMKGEVYTIRDIKPMGMIMRVLLHEIHNRPIMFPDLGGKVEPGFQASRFRPIDELETELEVSNHQQNFNLN